MGIFTYHIGKMDIPEEHREEYARQALKLLRAGGMMTVEELRLYRKKIYLLSPPEFDEEGRATGYYNYFEKECWEDWWLSTKRGTFGSNKVGGRQFCWAVVAAYILTALWSQGFFVTMVDGHFIYEKEYIGWINYVLGTQHSNQRMARLDEIVRLLHDNDRERTPKLYKILDEVPFECIDKKAFSRYCAAVFWADTDKERNPLTDEQMAAFLRDRTIAQDRTLADYISHAVCAFRDGGGTLERAEELLKMTNVERSAVYEADSTSILPLVYNREHTIFSVTQTAVDFGADFWEVWDRVKNHVPEEESDPAPQPCPPVEPISTQEFFNLEPDQMTYFWKPDGDIRLSDELTAWMRELRAELDGITETIPPEKFLETLVGAIDAAKCVFFRDAFYELIARQTEQKVQAAVLLMQRLAEREVPEHLWQYAALIGNPALRGEMLGF